MTTKNASANNTSDGAEQESEQQQVSVSELIKPARPAMVVATILTGLGAVLKLAPFVALHQVAAIWLGGEVLWESVWGWVVVALGGLFLGQLCYMLGLGVTHLAEVRLRDYLRRQVLSALARIPLGKVSQVPRGTIRKMVVDDTTSIHTLVAHGPGDATNAVVTVLAGCIYLLWVDWRFTLTLFAIVTVVLAVVITPSMRGYGSATEEYGRAQTNLAAASVEMLEGIQEIKNFQAAEATRTRYNAAREEFTEITYKWIERSGKAVWLGGAFLRPAIISVLVAILVAVFVPQGWMALEDTLPFFLLVPSIPEGVSTLLTLWQHLYNASMASQTTGRLLAEEHMPEGIKSREDVRDATVEMQHVTFGAAARLVEFARLQPVLRAVGVAGSWQPVISAVDADTNAAAQAMKIQGRPAQFFLIIVNAVFAVVLACGVAFVLQGSMEPVVFVVILATVARTTFPLAQASLLAGELDNTTVAASSVAEILDTDTLPEPSVPASPASSDVVLADVSFSYEERQILHQLSLTAPAGEMTAIVGPSGSGKTTILRLIARFWDVNSGSVRIGGVNVKDMPHDQLMGMVSMVFQDVYLFNTTIRENLRIARPDATDEELQEAARKARLDVAIEALPHGWDTQVGPAGLSLSGGERQRVAIARAFIKDAPILLLDEITSALDGENESAIAEVITELAKGRTVIVVAHRLNTIRNADSIYVLGVDQDGAYVAQHGTSAELSKQPGPFRNFVESSQAVTRWQIKS
ncbi:ABC transporter ATP-binding protein [Corynebacterium cystitidis]|uniref:ABC transporter ATP-binding protein n=1 Tax=Corynebacterium cystitidis TaxID=35757 RepID=UPI00211EC1B9|nr:ABC transporter ATP-binding protein [Corynebacterium cystitidis]